MVRQTSRTTATELANTLPARFDAVDDVAGDERADDLVFVHFSEDPPAADRDVDEVVGYVTRRGFELSREDRSTATGNVVMAVFEDDRK